MLPPETHLAKTAAASTAIQEYPAFATAPVDHEIQPTSVGMTARLPQCLCGASAEPVDLTRHGSRLLTPTFTPTRSEDCSECGRIDANGKARKLGVLHSCYDRRRTSAKRSEADTMTPEQVSLEFQEAKKVQPIAAQASDLLLSAPRDRPPGAAAVSGRSKPSRSAS